LEERVRVRFATGGCVGLRRKESEALSSGEGGEREEWPWMLEYECGGGGGGGCMSDIEVCAGMRLLLFFDMGCSDEARTLYV
jgi:hypothetical protein